MDQIYMPARRSFSSSTCSPQRTGSFATLPSNHGLAARTTSPMQFQHTPKARPHGRSADPSAEAQYSRSSGPGRYYSLLSRSTSSSSPGRSVRNRAEHPEHLC